MFTTLLESRRVRARSITGSALSVAAHIALLTLAVATTSDGRRLRDPAALDEAVAYESPAGAEVVAYVWLRSAEPAISSDARRAVRGARIPPTRVRRRVAPLEVPSAIPEVPEVDLSTAVVVDVAAHLLDFTLLAEGPNGPAGQEGRGALRDAIADAVGGRRAGPFLSSEVERLVLPFADNPRPEYPRSMLSARIGGQVVVRFVVDSAGRVDPASMRVLQSTNNHFARAVRTVLPRLHFRPAQLLGRNVDVVVEQAFRFEVR